MHALKAFGVWFACGIVITGASMFVPYECCADGPGRGFPFAVLSPSHGPSFGTIQIQPDEKNGKGFDFLSLAGDVILWGAAAAAAGVSLFIRTFTQRNAADRAPNKAVR